MPPIVFLPAAGHEHDRPAVQQLLIVGAKLPEQLADNIKATELQLAPDDLAQLDAASKLAPEYPAWMLERQGGTRMRQLADAMRGTSVH